ncbi:uncharacterized protein LOC142233333 [Haematobia irritans]|uniref:uncharacterized protein LOC142233333 n=1 Tax=Haematobia irritans TaxID=7368 RepID=UPI003F4F79E7
MENNPEKSLDHHGPRERTFSNISEKSSQSFKMCSPLLTSDSGLYTCSSNNSDVTIESDTDSWNASCGTASKLTKLAITTTHFNNNNNSLENALNDVKRLRSELERLTKSEQWYKNELRQQKSRKLEDLERIYTQERKYMQENQRLQNECMRLYEKCSEFEKVLRRNNHSSTQEIKEGTRTQADNLNVFEIQQQSALISDQKQLISVLRKQKKSLLNDLKSLTEEKDEKVMELQRHLADLELDNKRITKKCMDLTKQRSNLESNLKEADSKISLVLDEKLSMEKSLISLREQLQIQEQLVKIKENEIAQLQIEFKDNMHHEDDLDKVHAMSVKYQEIKNKTLEIIELRNQLSHMQEEEEELQRLQVQNDQQQREIEQLNFSLEACQLEMQSIRQSNLLKSQQIQELQEKTEMLLEDNDAKHNELVKQKQDFDRVCQELRRTKEQYQIIQNNYKETQFKVEFLEIEQSKLTFQTKSDQEEIQSLRQKLSDYLQQTSELVNKMHELENKLRQSVEENHVLRNDFEKLQNELRTSKCETRESYRNSNEYDNDFLQFSRECERLQNILDEHGTLLVTAQPKEKTCIQSSEPQTNTDEENISFQCQKLRENTKILELILKEKQKYITGISTEGRYRNEEFEKVLIENESLKRKINEIENEAYTLRLKQDIDEFAQKYRALETLFHSQETKVKGLQSKLLVNDAKLYKVEKQLKHLANPESSIRELRIENMQLISSLEEEKVIKSKLNAQLTETKDEIDTMKETLSLYMTKKIATCHKGVQCDEIDKQHDISQEVCELKEQLLDLQSKHAQYEKTESHKSTERLQLLQKISDIQNSKIQYIQDSQRDWEDMLTSLTSVKALEEETRRELELKRMELEELNQVFAEQNEELKKLEGLTAFLEFKRQQEKEHLKETFQKEIAVMKEKLEDCEEEIRNQQERNRELERRNGRIREDYNQEYAVEIANYRRELRSLKVHIERTLNEKDEMMQRISDLENELNEIKQRRREAVVLPQLLSPNEEDGNNDTNSNKCLSIVKTDAFGEDHLRILTKVLEAEYSRKMQRYDEHIHSLLTNVNSLKKSLKNNEEKTAILSEEQSRARDELKDLHNTKRNLEDLRFRYEQSQNTIKELKRELILERKKFESSDMGKSTQNEMSNYEVANLIDDYKKLIQQSALATKRPSNSTILDLIQRSNQCLPNLHNIETNIGNLRCDLQNFLSSYAQKMSSTPLITAASLNVPPSLMDELRAASEGF